MLKKASKFFQSHIRTSVSNDQNSNEDGTELPAVFQASYFYGRISRKIAENILTKRDKRDGAYLLRESITPMGNYSLTMMHEGKCVHYAIEKQLDGQYMIMDGKKFNDPLEFVQYYSINPGFVSPPKFPCKRSTSEDAIAFQGISYNDLHNHMKIYARKMNASLLRALGPLHETLMIHVLRKMHESLPWYHGEISRDEAISRLQKSGLEDGKFIVRCRNGGESYAITICHEGSIRHYIISILYGESYQIDNGPSFKALIILVDHYHNRRDGLACNLSMPCCEPNHKPEYWQNYKRLCTMYGKPDNSAAPDDPSSNLRVRTVSESNTPPTRVPPPPPKTPDKTEGSNSQPGLKDSSHEDFPDAIYNEPDEEDEDVPQDDGPVGRAMSQQEAQDLENVYLDIRTAVLSLQLQPEHLVLINELGSGQFGQVMKGTCMLGKTKVPVAVKTLKNQDPAGEKEIQSEANLMKKLDHKHIVRMIGVCKNESIMLVMELAELGPLKKFLQANKLNGLKQWHLLEISVQICDGMQYLQSMDVVHRDLATRNVLLLNEHFAKISDFGMSRVLDSDSEYYTAHGPGRWPLMWYAPECLYYHKFDGKSDVWSFGVTLWEIMSYADRPYRKMKIPQIVHFLESGYRMQKPKDCDKRIYSIMLECWEFAKERRPNFKEVKPKLEALFLEFRHLDL